MAAGVVSPPGSQWGACVEECMHRDCDASRCTARALCPHCRQPIGYDTGYFRTNDGPEHSICAYEAI